MKDYYASKDVQMTAAKYRDILHCSRPEPSYRHPRMPVPARAKIFSPFAALRGYEKEIEEEKWKKTRVPRKLLSEEEAEALSRLLSQVQKGTLLFVHYFQADQADPSSEPLGTYEARTGTVVKMDPLFHRLVLDDAGVQITICLDDLNLAEILAL